MTKGGSQQDISLANGNSSLSSPKSPAEIYYSIRSERKFIADPAQEAAILRLQRLYEDFVAYKAKRNTHLKKMIIYPELPRGVYLWGGVGRGKSLLMDLFYSCVPLIKKNRVHFHQFMREIHRELQSLKGEEDPLQIVAHRISNKSRLICFDEFHVSDIADAMILARLLEALFNKRVMFCMTSNYHPDDLYSGGLQRSQFLPAIALIKSKLDIVNVDNGVDYRSQAMERMQVYCLPLNEVSYQKLEKSFWQIAESAIESTKLLVEGRVISYVKRAGGVIWFTFKDLCESQRSQNDYLDLAQRFHTIILSDMPRMSPEMSAAARRFTWLVDIFYDQKVKLIISAEVAPQELYIKGLNSVEFSRTVSRLLEMQTKEYLSLPRVRG